MLLAQCFGSTDCQLPHSPPWWISAAFVAGWLTLVFGILALVIWQLRARGERRRRVGRQPGSDLEIYRRQEVDPY